LTLSVDQVTDFWRVARRLHAIYSELDHTFELGQPACADLENSQDSNNPEAMERVRQWFDTMDAHVQVWQLRQLLQSTSLQNEENLRYLIQRHLDRKQKTESDKEKIDFLLVQYFAHCAPHGINEQNLTLDEVAEVLQPALGKVPEMYPDWAPGLDDKLQKLNESESLEDLQNSGALLEVRELKLAVGDQYFDPGHLVAFTRFNFRARRAFFKAMHLDLHAIRGAVNELEKMGYTTLDCREAGLSESESLDQVRHVVHQWKTPFRAPYSGGSSFLQLILLRHALRIKLNEAYARHAGQGGEILEGTEEAPAPLIVAGPVVTEVSKRDIPKNGGPGNDSPSAEAAEATMPGPVIAAASATLASTPATAPVAEMSVGSAMSSFMDEPGSGNVREIDLDSHLEVATVPLHAEPPRPKSEIETVPVSATPAPPSAPAVIEAAPPPPPVPVVNTHVAKVTVAPPPVATNESTADETDADEHDDLQRCVADIAAQLVTAPPKNTPSVSAISLGGCKLLIATWEAEAFIYGADHLSRALKRTVAARTILHVCMERHKKHEPTNVTAALEIARVQSEKMHTAVLEAKDQKNIDAAVNLAATNKRLIALIEEGQKMVG
jgi:hypothetical protein